MLVVPCEGLGIQQHKVLKKPPPLTTNQGRQKVHLFRNHMKKVRSCDSSTPESSERLSGSLWEGGRLDDSHTNTVRRLRRTSGHRFKRLFFFFYLSFILPVLIIYTFSRHKMRRCLCSFVCKISIVFSHYKPTLSLLAKYPKSLSVSVRFFPFWYFF